MWPRQVIKVRCGNRSFYWSIFSKKTTLIDAWIDWQFDCLQSAIDKINIVKVYICLNNPFKASMFIIVVVYILIQQLNFCLVNIVEELL